METSDPRRRRSFRFRTFYVSPSDAEVRKGDTGNVIRSSVSSPSHSAHHTMAGVSETFPPTCCRPEVSRKLSKLPTDLVDSFQNEKFRMVLSQNPGILYLPLIFLVDCCSLHSAILRLQPKTVARSTRIASAFLRGALGIIAFSYIDPAVNIGDLGGSAPET